MHFMEERKNIGNYCLSDLVKGGKTAVRVMKLGGVISRATFDKEEIFLPLEGNEEENVGGFYAYAPYADISNRKTINKCGLLRKSIACLWNQSSNRVKMEFQTLDLVEYPFSLNYTVEIEVSDDGVIKKQLTMERVADKENKRAQINPGFNAFFSCQKVEEVKLLVGKNVHAFQSKCISLGDESEIRILMPNKKFNLRLELLGSDWHKYGEPWMAISSDSPKKEYFRLEIFLSDKNGVPKEESRCFLEKGESISLGLAIRPV